MNLPNRQYHMLGILTFLLNISSCISLASPPSASKVHKALPKLKAETYFSVREKNILFSNHIFVEMLIAHAFSPTIEVLSVSPSGKHFLVGVNKKDGGSSIGDLCICDRSGVITAKLFHQVELYVEQVWSPSERYIRFGRSIIDTKLRKSYDFDDYFSYFSERFLWSKLGACP